MFHKEKIPEKSDKINQFLNSLYSNAGAPVDLKSVRFYFSPFETF